MEVYLQSQTRDYSSVGTAEEVRMIDTVSQLFLWDPTHGRQSKGHPAITSTAQLAGEGHWTGTTRAPSYHGQCGCD